MHNPKDILYGRLPHYRLSDRGRRQAEATARFLASRTVSAIYTSPLLRARQTAEIFSAYHPRLRPRLSSDLLEVKTGYQGSPNSILKPGFSFFEPLKEPNDETMEQVWIRMRRFMRRAIKRHAGETVVAVGHADPIKIMRVGLLGLEMTVANLHAAIEPARASINQITFQPGGTPSLTYFDVNREGRP